MAKTSNGLGQFSGKLGGVVYVVQNGQQVVRAYQPVVSNPKSPLQLAQRSKGNLAGRISSFVPSTAIMGLGANSRQRRGAFMSQILKNASAVSVGSDWVAKIQPEDVLFSKGAVVLPVSLTSIVATSHNVAVALTGAADTAIDPSVYTSRLVRLVAMVYEANSTNLVEVSSKVATMPAQGASATSNISIAYAGGYDVYIYAIPMSTNDGSAAAIDTTVVGLDDDQIAASLSVNGKAVVFAYGRSVLLGDGNFTQA